MVVIEHVRYRWQESVVQIVTVAARARKTIHASEKLFPAIYHWLETCYIFE